MMYQANIELNGQLLHGTLDFYVLHQVQHELKKMGRNITIPQIFEAISKEDFECIFMIFICSLNRISGFSIKEIEILSRANIDKNESIEWRASCYMDQYRYLNDLFEACLVVNVQGEESEFEDIPLSSSDDWNFSWLEYQWMSVLQRDNFWSITPKNFMQQLEAHQKYKGIKKESFEEL